MIIMQWTVYQVFGTVNFLQEAWKIKFVKLNS